MISNSELIQRMAEVITEMVKKALDSEGRYDKTYTATVIEKIAPNKYTVEYNGGKHTARSHISLSPGDLVMVCSPCSDDSALFVLVKVS